MLKRSLIFLLLLTLHTGLAAAAASGQSAAAPAADARREFTTVEGANLSARIAAARRLADARPQKTPYWLAYSFDVRPGVSVDLYQAGTGSAAGGWPLKPAPKGGEVTRNLGVFLLHEPTGESVARVEVYNLERQRDYGGHQVYWLGASRTDESLSLLRTLVRERQVRKVVEPAATAIALHNDARAAAAALEDIVRHSTYERARTRAIFWLGQFDGQQPFLTSIVGNDEESTEVRKQAAFSIGVGKDKGALEALQGLYGPVGNREVKKQIIFAASVNESQDRAVDFLINVAQTETDRELRKLAVFWLGSKAAERGGPPAGREGGQSVFPEAGGQTIFAISRRPREEATPLLLNIATTHPNAAVRQEAMFWLGQINGEEALKLYKEVLKK